MISWMHLLYAIPVSAFIGFFVAALMAAAKRGDEHQVDAPCAICETDQALIKCRESLDLCRRELQATSERLATVERQRNQLYGENTKLLAKLRNVNSDLQGQAFLNSGFKAR
jgi:hypothetical protein